MAFTYDPTTALGALRLAIGDSVDGSGPRPGTATNFTDAELGALGGAASAFRVLAAEWARQADTQAGPLRKSSSQIASRYQQLAAVAQAQADASGTGSYTAFAAPLGRADGYAVRVGRIDEPV